MSKYTNHLPDTLYSRIFMALPLTTKTPSDIKNHFAQASNNLKQIGTWGGFSATNNFRAIKSLLNLDVQ